MSNPTPANPAMSSPPPRQLNAAAQLTRTQAARRLVQRCQLELLAVIEDWRRLREHRKAGR